MGNDLPMASQQQVRALLQLGWSHRRIARELGVHRETVSRYVRQQRAGPPVVIAGSEDEPVRQLAVLQNRPNPITGPPSLAAPITRRSRRRWSEVGALSGSGRT